MNARVRITVLRRSQNLDFLEAYADSVWEPCERLIEGAEFVSHGANIPIGFCSWAWADIQKYVLTLARGGNFLGVREGTFVTCCTDGFRPVFFKVERMRDDEPEPIIPRLREQQPYDIDHRRATESQCGCARTTASPADQPRNS
ncbi:MAG: TIGR04076 family protein [Thermomicrobiales bacterium]